MSVMMDRRAAALSELAECESQVRLWQAHQQRVLARLAAGRCLDDLAPRGVDKHWVREEVSCVLRVSPDSARLRLANATDAATYFPELVEALELGETTLAHVMCFADAARALSPAHKRRVLDLVLDQARVQAVAAFRQSVRRAVLTVCPVEIEENRKALEEQRRVAVSHGEGGMSELFAELRTEDAAALAAAVEDTAQCWARQPGETRTLAQLRADALVYLSTGSSGDGRPGAVVNVCVALSTLSGLDDAPAELTADLPTSLGGGIVPISAEQARRIAFATNTTWRRLITDDCGQLLDYGRSTYRPPAPLARFVRARDRTCTFPHCARPAARCDTDHRDPWECGGATCEWNLHCLCSRHHHLKHETRWQVSALADGTTRWTSPVGRTHDRLPATYPIDRTNTTVPPPDTDWITTHTPHRRAPEDLGTPDDRPPF